MDSNKSAKDRRKQRKKIGIILSHILSHLPKINNSGLLSSVLFPNNRGLFVAALWEVFTLWHQRLLLQWKKSKTQRHHISFLGSGQLVFLVPRCFVSSSLRNQRNRFLNRSLFDCNAVCQEKRGGRAASNFNWKREKGCYAAVCPRSLNSINTKTYNTCKMS